MSYAANKGINLRIIINDKMHCLDDFGICSYDDSTMRENLKKIISENPNKNPQEVIDNYCRPIIYNKVWSYD